jgi:hypothetical protein
VDVADERADRGRLLAEVTSQVVETFRPIFFSTLVTTTPLRSPS